VGDCCGDGGYGETFGSSFSRRLARRYRKRGLTRTAARIVEVLESRGIEGASVLEIGGGVGDIQVELLRRGAATTTNLELVDSYERDAGALAAEARVVDRVVRRQLDIAQHPDEVDPHDIVVLHRVVCCYGDYDRLLGEAARHARQVLVFSHPPRNPISRAMFGTENLLRRMSRSPFRTYVHRPSDLVRAAESGGMRVVHAHRGLGWHVVALESVG
jgi:2-polyprenyl-3-methyl-5-hydroxy-6-metoxy-1,4-benzoquinol methylase